jgi:hypothetical protein
MNDFCQQVVLPQEKGLSNPEVPEQRGSITPPLKRSLLSMLKGFIYNKMMGVEHNLL